MQKYFLKLALTGLAAGLCLSAQGGGSEIAMSKCTRTPTADDQSSIDDQMMMDQSQENGDNAAEENSYPNSQSGSSPSGSWGSQGDQSSQNESLKKNKLSAAKSVLRGEKMPGIDK